MLLAVCNADYCFTLSGSYGSNNNCHVLSNSLLGEAVETNTFNIPEDEPLDGCKFTPLPYFLLGNDIFPLKKWLIKPYPGIKSYLDRNLSEEPKIYNYCLSRARRVIENAFAILAVRWRIFHQPIPATVEHVELYVLRAVALPYLCLACNAMYTASGFVDSESGDGRIHLGGWHNRHAQAFNNIRPIRGNRNCIEVVPMRTEIKEYLNSEEGNLPWQQDYIRRTYRNNNT